MSVVTRMGRVDGGWGDEQEEAEEEDPHLATSLHSLRWEQSTHVLATPHGVHDAG